MGRFNLEDTLRSIRALVGETTTPKVDVALDPATVRYLEQLGVDASAFKSRFGFDPDTLYPKSSDVTRAARSMDAGPPAPVDLGVDAPIFPQMSKAQNAYDNLRSGRTANLRNSGGDLARIAGDNIRAADDAARASGKASAARDAAYLTGGALGLAALGTGVAHLATPGTSPALTESGNPADLRDEPESASDILSRPEFPLVPQEDIRIPKKHFYDMDGRPFDESVRGGRPEAELMQPVAQPADYSMQARELIDKLNAMRRAASPEVLRANGGDVPGAQVIMREIDRLLELGNQTRRATYVAAPRDEAGRLYQQAQGLIDQVNQLQSQGYPHGSPQVQRLMTQVRQLQSHGDAIRNRRAG